jgi:hypothetical protein
MAQRVVDAEGFNVVIAEPEKLDMWERITPSVKIVKSPSRRWWRSPSPGKELADDLAESGKHVTHHRNKPVVDVHGVPGGVFGFGKRVEFSSLYRTSYSTQNKLPGDALGVKAFETVDPITGNKIFTRAGKTKNTYFCVSSGCISGYSGFVPGKADGSCTGGTFDKANDAAHEHLRHTRQALAYNMYVPEVHMPTKKALLKKMNAQGH